MSKRILALTVKEAHSLQVSTLRHLLTVATNPDIDLEEYIDKWIEELEEHHERSNVCQHLENT